jgi:hypothetical protein
MAEEAVVAAGASSLSGGGIAFCDNCKFAEAWTYRFPGAAIAEPGPAFEAGD